MSSAAAADDRKCPICLGEAEYGIVTNCKHLFCARCIANYVTYDLAQGKWPILCPYCRQQVSDLRMRVSDSELEDVVMLEQMDCFCCKFHRYHVKRSELPAEASSPEAAARRKKDFRSSMLTFLHNGRLQYIFGSVKWNL